ncbi:putative death-receptor fusion protein-domain-containing protein [Triangularia verruculosa]|uniref:Death-receptor fusion protein-domain-containing protein n=1 Tax=Triangularia verruculosa TaxID=2587418 RepID=A0AAN6XDD8_9PEZI|nr:putative death-receptor fusion protein-domain-containing protein [Triangularia verruculosa]
MEGQSSDGSTDALISGLDSEIFENANTISKWLLSQPEETRPRLAEGLFQKLFQDASQSRQYHGNGHACVRLCSFVQQCFKSPDQALKKWATTEALTLELFLFYLEWYEHDPHRALRLVLDVLVTACTNNPCSETGRSIKSRVLDILVQIITRKYSKQLTKSGLQCLEHLLSKRVISLDDIVLTYKQVEPSVTSLPILQLWKSFLFHLFSWMEITYVCPLAGKCIVHVFRGLDSATALDPATGFDVEVWRQWLQDALFQNPDILEDIKNYVLVAIFKTDKAAALRLLQVFNKQQLSTNQQGSDQGILLQLATLELGKKTGLVDEPTGQPEQSKHLALDSKVLGTLLGHPSNSVRCSALSLVVSSQATTKPLSNDAFNLLRTYLAAFHADYDAKVRNEVLGLTKNLLKRVKSIITVAQRSLAEFANKESQLAAGGNAEPPLKKKKAGPEAALRDSSEAQSVLTSHKIFLEWYVGFIRDELIPTASYQRHITAVKAALLAVRVGKHAAATDDTVDEDVIQLVANDSTWTRLLFDLLLDPFDDVREAASTLLSLIPQELITRPIDQYQKPTTLLDVLRNFCQRASALADRTGRADHGDGAARAQGLMCSWLDSPHQQIQYLGDLLTGLDSKVRRAEVDLGHAAIESPVHPDFAAISYIWQVLTKQTYSEAELKALHQLQGQIFDAAQRIWLAVKHVLCDDSPEGHLPEEMEDIEGLDTKDLLSYSFRAVHESSNLLRLIMGTLRLKTAAGVPYPPLEMFKMTGYLTFEQLASLRHRGAFSTVSYTFTNCCQLTQNLKAVYPNADESDNLLREWYKGAVECIMTQASTTRRSAGIPSLIAAVLSANASSPSFDEVYSNLEEIGKKPVTQAETDGSNLPQVHALNCLREIFRNSLLSKRAEGYLARTLNLASTSLKSEVWAIRNCGLLLLRALIDCLLGTGESKAIIESGWDGNSVRISYNKYPELPDIILGLLQADDVGEGLANSAAAEAVFPALDIIRRAGPPEEHRDELRKRIENYLGSKIWHVREIAARTLCSFLLGEDWVSEIGKLLEQAGTSSNRLHGALLTARFVIERKSDLANDLMPENFWAESLVAILATKSDVFGRCQEVEAAYLEILNLLMKLQCLSADKLASTLNISTKTRSPASALLEMEIALGLVHESASSGDVAGLRSYLVAVLAKDVNIASRMLEAIPTAFSQAQNDSSSVRSELCQLYLDVCGTSPAPEARAASLTNLGALMSSMLSGGHIAELPSLSQLDTLWSDLTKSSINPELSWAITEASGTIMAVLVSHHKTNLPDLDQRLRSWGALISDSLDVDNSFDTRHAAASSLHAFFSHIPQPLYQESYLPAFAALYTALTDDDDEVREVAALAASRLTGEPATANIAAKHLIVSQLPHELTNNTPELFALAITRLTDGLETNPAESQLGKALDFDDSLFAAEEQNLFVDEIRETKNWRWAAVAAVGRNDALIKTAAFTAWKLWTKMGLGALISIMEEKGTDEPLGWTSDQHVFAAVARIVLSAGGVMAVMRGEEGDKSDEVEEEIKQLLGRVRDMSQQGKMLHGSLEGLLLGEQDGGALVG